MNVLIEANKLLANVRLGIIQPVNMEVLIREQLKIRRKLCKIV